MSLRRREALDGGRWPAGGPVSRAATTGPHRFRVGALPCRIGGPRGETRCCPRMHRRWSWTDWLTRVAGS